MNFNLAKPMQIPLHWKTIAVLVIFLHMFSAHAAKKPDHQRLTTKVTIKQMAINGLVVDHNGLPIENATITEKGTKNATQTNDKGRFKLQVNSLTALLTVSSVGYADKEVVASAVSMVVLNQQQDQIEEVVVVGYGTQKKTNLTSAVSQVDSKLLQDRPSPSIVNMLQGAAPGLVVTRNSGRPGSQGLSMQIRGETSANGNVPPLIVIDGVISSQESFSALNPGDIENINILKDGGATAIYGAQSAGGVILVTTKIGKIGKPRINLSSNLGIQRPGNIPKRLSLIDEMNYVNLARANAGLNPEYSEEDLYYAVNGPAFVLGDNGLWRTYNQESLIDMVVKDYYTIYNHNVQISGANEKIAYMASLGNMSQNGMFKVGDDKYSRTNARVNLSARITNFLKLDVGSTYTQQSTDNPQDGGYGLEGGGNGILRQLFSSRMRFPIYNEDGSYYRNGTSSAFGYALLKDGGFNTDKKGTYFNTVTATIDNLIDGLTARLMYSREDTRLENQNFRRTVTYYSGPQSNSASQLNNPNNFSIQNRNSLRQNYQAILDYDLKINAKHNFHVMAGYQFYDYVRKQITASTKNLYVNDNPSLNFTADPANKSHSQEIDTEKMQSYFGRFNYNFKEKYLFEATVRSDESSRLSPNKRIKVFPSFSTGWNIHKEHWFDKFSGYINELKPRVSWGKVASNLGIGYYDYIGQLTIKTDLILGDGRQTYVYQNLIPATNLTWETIETRNYGIDFSLLNRKLSGSFDYFNKFNNNMLVSVAYPNTIGIRVPKSNEGKLKTWGWEAALSYRDKIGTDFSYSVALSMADNKNKLIYFGGASNIISPGVNKTVEGFALKSIWGYQTDGYFQNQEELQNAPSYQKLLNVEGVPGLGDIRYIDINGDGEISPGKNTVDDSGDLRYLGDTNPRYQYGLNVNLNYKNFDVSFFIQGIAKRKFKPSNELIQPQLYSWYLPMSFQMDYWTPENRNAAYPRPYLQGNQNFQDSDKWFMNGAYARLKNIQIGYSLTKETFKALPFSRIRLFASGEDLLTVSKLGIYKGVIDPEMKPEDSKVSPYPFTTTISFGLNVDF